MTITNSLAVLANSAPALVAGLTTNATAITTVTTTAINASTLSLQTGGTTGLYIDGSQNVGIGTTSPAYKLDVNGQSRFTSNFFVTNGSIQLNDGYGYTWGNTYLTGYAGNYMAFVTNASERMRIDSSGNLLLGTTSATGASGGPYLVAGHGINTRTGAAGSYGGNLFNINWTGSAAQLWIDVTNVGNISLSSDYRIKKNVQTQTVTALDRLNKIRPVTYTFADNEQIKWKADGVAREGFIAHELAEIIPSAVEGAKDAPDQIQSLRLDALCSVLVKAIQELKAEFDEYKASHP